MKYTITHSPAGKKTLNTVTDEDGNVVATRKGVPYVKCVLCRMTMKRHVASLESAIDVRERAWIPSEENAERKAKYVAQLVELKEQLADAPNKTFKIGHFSWHKTLKAKHEVNLSAWELDFVAVATLEG